MLHDLSLGLLEVFLFHCFGLTKTSEVKGHFTTLVVTVDSLISSVLLSEYQLNKHQQCTHQTRYCCCLFSPDTSLIRQWIYSAISIVETTKASPLSILIFTLVKKNKVSPYSITENRVTELILVLGSQPAGDVSHKPGCRLPLLSAKPAVTPATLKGAATNFAAL